MLVKSQATRAPAAVRPPRQSTTAAGRQYAQVNSSSRVQRTETGFPAARARRAASTAASAVCFPPKPPPMSGTIDANAVARDAERLGEDLLRAEGPVAADPDGEAIPAPLGHGGARLHRGVLDEGDLIRLRQDPVRLRQRRLDRAPLVGARLAPARLRAKVLEQVLVRDGLGRRLPGGRRGGCVERLRCTVRGRRREADERPLADRDHVAHGLGRRRGRPTRASLREPAAAGRARTASPGGGCRRGRGARR